MCHKAINIIERQVNFGFGRKKTKMEYIIQMKIKIDIVSYKKSKKLFYKRGSTVLYRKKIIKLLKTQINIGLCCL